MLKGDLLMVAKEEIEAPVLTERQKRIKTGVFTLAHIFNDSYPNTYPVLLPLLMSQMGFGIAAAGLISAFSALSTQLLQPVMGFWADRSGGKKFVVGGLAIGSIVIPLGLGFTPSYALLLLALLVGGLGNAAFHPHAAALVGEMTGKRKGFGMSLFIVGGNLGRALAPIMASAAVLWSGGRHGLILLAIPGLIMALVMNWTMSPPPAPKPREEKILTPEFILGLRHARPLLGVVGLRSMATMSTLTLVPILGKSLGHSMTTYATLLTVLFIAGSIGNVAGGALSDIFGPKPVLIGSAVLASGFLFAFVESHSILMAYIFIALLGLTLYSSTPVTMVFSQALFPKNKGMASGFAMGIGGTIGSLGVAIIGLIADLYSPTVGLVTVSLILLLSVPLVVILKNDP